MWHRKLIIGLALCLVITSAVLAQQEKWNELNQQAAKLYQEGKSIEATTIAERALEVGEKTFGPDNANVATSLDNLARLYGLQRRYAEAESLYKRSLTIREKALGPDHPDVATSLNNMAELYAAQGKYSEAESLYKRSLAIYEKAFGPDHPAVARSLNNLAQMYEQIGKKKEASECDECPQKIEPREPNP
jgi:tetratricopeptide (TPR) repeat protein